MELKITWRRAARIWLSYIWRNLIAIVAAMLIGMVVGAIIGFIMGAIGFQIRTIQLVTAPLGGVIGLLISIVPMKLILGKDFGEFRLVLLAKEAPSSPNVHPTPTDDNAA
jgi:Na+/citrate or Na+/malate symporter